MPAPTSNDEFIDLIRRSGVSDDTRLSSYVQQLRESGQLPGDPSKLAGLMVRDGLLTFFQAEQFLMGKWKRFTIGKYKVLERLGSGGMGQVFLCEHKLMRRRVAVKVLPTAKADDASSLERFYREARAVAALDHPNIVRAYDIDQDDNLHFLVMEYVDGSSLQDIIKKCGRMDPIAAAHYIAQAAVGLHHAHESGLIHRDIKPGNLLVDRTGTMKILDMGLARFFHDEDDNITKRHDESVLGTADYLAPEQAIDSHSVDIRADIYSLGATMYFMLTGSPPFAEGTIAQKLIWHQTRPPKPLTQYRQDVPEGLVSVLSVMMAKEPPQRYQHPIEVAHALAPWTQSPLPLPPDEWMPHLCLAAQGNQAVTAASGAAARTIVTRAATTSARPTSQANLYLPPAPPTGYAPPPPATLPGQSQITPPVSPATAPSAAPTTVSNGHLSGNAPAFWESVTDAGYSPGAPPPPLSASSTPRPRSLPIPKLDNRKIALYASVGGAAFLTAVVLALLFMRWTGSTDKTAQVPQGSTGGEFLVGPDGPHKSINAALAAFAEQSKTLGHGRIIITGDITEDRRIVLDAGRFPPYKNLVIEGRGETMPVVRAGKADTPGTPMIDATGVEGLEIRNLALDGQGKYNVLVQAKARSAGLTLDRLFLTGFKQVGVILSNCAGDASRPVRVSDCRILASQPAPPVSGRPGEVMGIWLQTRPLFASLPTNQHLEVSSCRLEGSTSPDVRIVGVALDGPHNAITLANNRYFRCTTAVDIRKTAKGPFWCDLTVRSSTFYDNHIGIGWDGVPTAEAEYPSQLVIEKNFFAKTKQLLAPRSGAGKFPELQANNNAIDDANASKDNSNAPLKPTVIAFQFKTTNPDQDDFLTYPPDAPLAEVPYGYVPTN